MPPGSQRKKQASKASTTCSLCTHSTSSCTCSEPSPAAPSSTRPQPRTRTRTRAGAAAAAAAPPGLSPAAAPGPAAAPAPDPVSAAAVAASGSAGSPAAAAPPSGPGPAAISGSASAHAGLQLATSSGPAAWPAAAAASPSPEPAASSGPAAARPAPAGPAATPLHSAPATAAAEAVEAATAASTLTFSPHFMPGSEDEDDETDGKTTFSESKSRHLWLSTVDALNHVKGSPKWQFIDDDRKRARVVREKYWRLVKEAAILSNRTGIHIFLATGRSDRVTQGLKEHVFVSEELCNPANKCLHDTAHAMALSWSSGLAAYRETLIAQNKAKDELLRQHQAQFLANQRQLQEKEAALTAALADAAAMREELDQIRATNVAGSTSAGGPSLAPEST
ncbi:hypothetical protein A4X06_0g8003 [Tilletia controversa]|uniref:Uncharacterized protein n=1 Tax=Tilletia controversa TaxID=13291 RepID=A0A8X7ML34_9BASI|nr:hypothetical protein A4X06_0g8003 [Tilletia controversa]